MKIYHKIWNRHPPDDSILPGDGNVIHHIDFDHYNDDPDNLQKMTRAEHNVVHFKDRPAPKIAKLKTGLRLSYETRMKQSRIMKEKYSNGNHPLCGIKRDDIIGDNNPMADPIIREKQRINIGKAQRKRRLKEKISKMNLLLIFGNLLN
ncbi:MAG: hypothetical protein ACFFDY_00495 [Candidatus Thorarchaeota archaeon]